MPVCHSCRESLKGEHFFLSPSLCGNAKCGPLCPPPPPPKSISLSGVSGVHDFICSIISSLGNAGFVSETTRMCWANTAPSQAASGLAVQASYARKLPRSCFSMRSSLMIWGCLIWWTGLNTRAVLRPNKRAVVSKCFCSFLGLRFCTKVGIHSSLRCSFIFHTDSVASVIRSGSSKFCNGGLKRYWGGGVFSPRGMRSCIFDDEKFSLSRSTAFTQVWLAIDRCCSCASSS